MRRGYLTTSILALQLALASACGPSPGAGVDGGSDTGDGTPIKVKTPPAPKEGTGTVDACKGVTQRGTCEDGVAKYCDLEREAVRRNDCKAKGRECVVDSGRGAICKELNQPVTEQGFCVGEVAAYKDSEGVPQLDDCAARGLKCLTTCEGFDGAYCCNADGSAAPDPTDTNTDACQGYDLAGKCEGGVAKYCLNGKLQQDTCSGGQTCEENECALGAYCCGKSANATECEELGFEGRCENGLVRYCDGVNIVESQCSGGQTCQENTCYANGAECCDVEEDRCGGITNDGACDGNTLKFCEDGDLVEINCANNETAKECGVNDGGFASCRKPQLSECEQLGFAGICLDANTVRYCSFSGEVKNIDCTSVGRVCKPTGCSGGTEPNAVCCDP